MQFSGGFTVSGGVTFVPPLTVLPYTLYSWGSNSYGRLGLNNSVFRSSPVQVGTDTDWNNISISSDSGMATKADGTLWLWGRNNYGQLGLNDRVNRSSPIQIGSSTGWNLVSCGSNSTLATKSA